MSKIACIGCGKEKNHNEHPLFSIKNGTQRVCLNCMYQKTSKYAMCMAGMACKRRASNMRYINLPENNAFKVIFSCNGRCNNLLAKGLKHMGGLHSFKTCKTCDNVIRQHLICIKCKGHVKIDQCFKCKLIIKSKECFICENKINFAICKSCKEPQKTLRCSTCKTKKFLDKCSFCKTPTKKPLQCSRCKNIVYCSRDCQIKDWRVHKKQCFKKIIIPNLKKVIKKVEDKSYGENKNTINPDKHMEEIGKNLSKLMIGKNQKKTKIPKFKKK